MYLGLLLAALGGACDASQPLVMGLAKRWRWEAIWLVWSIFGCLILPWTAALLILGIPLLGEIYQSVPASTLILVATLGAGWGIGAIFFGLGVIRVGMGLGLGIVVSLTAANGALLPMLQNNPEMLLTSDASAIYVSVGSLILGIVLCSMAAHRRRDEKPLLEREPTNFTIGVLYCIASGFTSPLINVAFTVGLEISESASRFGVGPLGASLAPVTLIMSGGCAVNAFYCFYLLRRNGSWRDFAIRSTKVYWAFGIAMGFLQMLGFVLFTIAAARIDKTTRLGGTVIGWPVYTACVILVGNLEGLLRGEWRGSDRTTFTLLGSGLILVVLSSAIVVAFSSYLVLMNS